jgi:hypothetical protein
MGKITPSGTGMSKYRNTFVTREFFPMFPEPETEEAAENSD